MKPYLLILLLSLAPGLLPAAESPRQVINFNRDWKFLMGDHVGAESIAFDDSQWDAIGLPHSFSLPYFGAPHFYTGYGWYRKHFEVPAEWSGKDLFLEFDGAFQVAEIFVNGRPVADHRGGYTGFSVAIADAVRPGNNVVAVRLNNLWNAQLAPRAGEHVFSGGIYRDVRLVVTEPLHVAWYGTFVTTPQISVGSGVVNVKTEIQNDAVSAKVCTLQTDIKSPDGKVVASVSSTKSVPAGMAIMFDQTTPAVVTPQLWGPGHPNLYEADSKVMAGNQVADNYKTTFGFRWFEWTAENGFFLNGAHYYFEGADVHQDHAGWGDAVTDSGCFRDVKLVKDAGFNFVRGSHYPHAPAFADACDELGVLFWSENCFWGMGGRSPDGFWNASAYPTNAADTPAFEQSVRNSLRDMIRINRNHASIIAWSMCNEVFFSEKSTLPAVRSFLQQLVAMTHELDPTRPAGIGGCQRANLDHLGDIAGYNGDGARLYIDPGFPNLVTEYGSVRAVRPGKYEPGWGNLVQGPGDRSQPFFWRYPWRSGEVLWCMFDHGSIAGDEGRTGIVDYFRLPKRAWYWYRNEYRKIPPPSWPSAGTPGALSLSADKTFLKAADGTDDAQIVVTVVDADGHALTNSPPVTLTIISGPGEFPTGPSITFEPDSDIAIRDGLAAIEFRSFNSGVTKIRATSLGLKEAEINITTQGGPKFIAGETPSVKPRPYVRFAGVAGGHASPIYSMFGMSNPSQASSEISGHGASLGNDGSPETFWQANPNDANPWWQLDLERAVTIAQLKLTFPTADNYRYKVETSADGVHWVVLSDKTQTSAVDKIQVEKPTTNISAHLVRVTFKGMAAIAEIEIVGQLTAQ